MKYAEEKEPQDYYNRMVLLKEDSISTVWLTKIKILSLILLFSTIYSCQYNKAEAQERKKVEYFNGIVVDPKKNALSGVNVVCIVKTDSSNLRTAITNADGYFKFWDPKFDQLNIEEGANLIFSKEGYISDTVATTQPAPEYKKYPNNYFFIHQEPDTLILKKVIPHIDTINVRINSDIILTWNISKNSVVRNKQYFDIKNDPKKISSLLEFIKNAENLGIGIRSKKSSKLKKGDIAFIYLYENQHIPPYKCFQTQFDYIKKNCSLPEGLLDYLEKDRIGVYTKIKKCLQTF